MKINNRFIPTGFLGCKSNFEEADIVLFGAPFDGTVTNRPGSRFAPQAIRNDSYGLETFSPYQNSDLEDYQITDLGDLDLPFGNKEAVMQIIEDCVLDIVNAGKRPLMIGGEHLVTLPAIKVIVNHTNYKDLCIIHLDAHTDLRQEYIGEPISHSTVIYKAWELIGDNQIWQFGIRSGTRDEFKWAETGHTFLQKFNLDGLKEAADKIGSRPVYLTIDLDVLDPSIFPGTGTPEAGGITFKELMDGLISIAGLNIIGADIVELSPHYDQSGTSTATACKVVREVMLLMSGKNHLDIG
jgi:agmatinase